MHADAKPLDPAPLTGETIRLSDHPSVLAFSDDGARLACVGISSVHVVDVATRAWQTTTKTREASALCWLGEGLAVGAKTIAVIDPDTGKKRLAMKGHKAAAQAMVSDGARLYTGGGSYIYTDDRFVRAFDLDTGDLAWKAKPGKAAGALSLTLVGDRVCVAAEDGHVRMFAAKDGAALGELELGPAQEYGSIFGGVVGCGPGLLAAVAVHEQACTVSWIELDPKPRVAATTPIPLANVDPDEGCFAAAPLATKGRVLAPIYYCVEGYSRTILAELDVASRSLLGLHAPAGLDDPRSCALSVDGTLAWRVHDGVTLANLLGGATAKPESTAAKTKAAKTKTAKPRARVEPLGDPVGATPGGLDRRACYAGELRETPTLAWARAEYRSGAGEFGGSAAVGAGMAIGSSAEDVAALAAKTGETLWSTRCAKPRSWATSGIAIADEAVFMATNQGLHAFAAAGGELLWTAKIKGAAGAPIVFADACVIAGNEGLHARSRAKKGRKLWSFDVKDRVAGAPAYAGGTFYLYADARLVAVDAASLAPRWSLPAMMPLRSHPVVAGRLVVYMPEVCALAAVDRDTGAEVWRVKSERLMGGSAFAASDERIVFRDAEGWLCAHDLDDGARAWTSKAGRDEPYGIGYAGPIVVGDTVVCVTVEASATRCYLTGLSLADGALRWDLDHAAVKRKLAAEQRRSGSSFAGEWSWNCTPTFAGGMLYAQTDAGLVALK